MTDKYIEISKEVNKKGVAPVSKDLWDEQRGIPRPVYLVYNNGACAELAAEYQINIDHYDSSVHAVWHEDGRLLERLLFANLADHNNDRMLATNYAILSTVIEIEKAEDLARIDDSDLAEWHGNRDCH